MWKTSFSKLSFCTKVYELKKSCLAPITYIYITNEFPIYYTTLIQIDLKEGLINCRSKIDIFQLVAYANLFWMKSTFFLYKRTHIIMLLFCVYFAYSFFTRFWYCTHKNKMFLTLNTNVFGIDFVFLNLTFAIIFLEMFSDSFLL